MSKGMNLLDSCGISRNSFRYDVQLEKGAFNSHLSFYLKEVSLFENKGAVIRVTRLDNDQ